MKKTNIQDEICDYLKEGMLKKEAATLACINESTFYRWLKEDASFASRVEANIIEFKRSLIQTMNKNSETNGMLALKILERRWPEEWALKRITNSSKNRSAGKVIIVDSLN